MGWSSYTGKTEVSEKSKRLERIDVSLKRIDDCWIAPLNLHVTGRYSYEVIISILKILFNDVYDKLDKKEQKLGDAMIDEVEEMLLDRDNQIFVYKRDDSMSGSRTRLVKNSSNWRKVERKLYQLDRIIRGWIGANMREELYADEGEVTEVGSPSDMEMEEDE